jgi:hypothetical protein
MQSKIIHLISGIIILILVVITIREYLFGDSLLIYRDVRGFDPELSLYNALNVFNLDATRRILYLGPFLSFTTTLGLSPLIAQKLSFVIVHFMIGFFAYLASYKFLLFRSTEYQHKRFIFIAALIFGFFYLYNPRMAQGLGITTWGYAFSYSLIPLIFYYYDKSLHDTRFLNIFITSVLISLAIAATAQFLVGLPFFILLPWLLFVCIRNLKLRKPVFPAIRTSLLIFSLFFAISFYWIYITMLTIGSDTSLQPDYVLTNQMLNDFSSSSNLSNVVRLMSSWWPYIDLEPNSGGLIGTFLSFVIPITVVLSILFVKYDKLKFELITLALIALFIIFLAKGTQEPLPELYPHLYDIPLVGWMFRLPSSIAVFLPFYFGMIITFGIYSLLRLQLKNTIQNWIRFACPAILVVSIASVGWSMFTGDFGGIYKDNKFVENTLREESYHIGAPSENIMVFGDLSKHELAESLFNTNHSSLIMTGNNLDILQQTKVIPDKVILDDKEDLAFYLLNNNSVLVEPFTTTRNHKPSEVWSIARTNDPLHGPFHRYLEKFGINNTDMDYNKGLVLTWGRDELRMPLEVKGTADYHLFVRYLESEAGGEMKVALDGRTVNSIFTKSSENKFVWKDIGTFDDLPNGKHTLMLQNDNGLNAVNIFALIPSDTLIELDDRADNFIERSKLVYILDREDLLAQGSEKTIIDEQSNQTAFRIDPKSSVYRDIDLPKTSNYMVAINATTCKECQTLNVSIGSFSKEFSIRSSAEGFRWLYFPVTLEAGKTNLGFYSEEGAYITTVLIQSDDDGERLDLFGVNETPVVISDIKRVSPTKYEISVNAERPFMITFDRPYNNQWSAFVNGREYSSLMLYPSINGFYIDDSGLLKLTIEYKPENWFIQGAIITIITMIGSVGFLLWQKHERIPDYLERFRTKILNREARGSIR